MEKITLSPIWHNGQLCIAIRGRLKGAAFKIINNIEGRSYSKTHACYYVSYSREKLEGLRNSLSAFGVELTGWEEDGKGFSSAFEKTWIRLPAIYSETLVRMRYSEVTRKNYEIQFRKFLGYVYPLALEAVTQHEVNQYLFYLVNDRKVSRSTQNQAINSIKFYFEKIKHENRQTYHIERPRKERSLPDILSEEEVAAMLQKTSNLKHKCILCLLYSAGLRRGELLRLKVNDIDIDRNVIHVRAAKGAKDRLTLLSKVACAVLSRYKELYMPKEFLIEGDGGMSYSEKSLNNVVKRAASLAGIQKNVTPHTLRHSFATHLLEQGTDLRYIQELLGHESSKTTELYAQVTKKAMDRLVSPLDNLAQRHTLDGTKEGYM